ncbi:MAG: hypothetical protein QS721_03865 [Candidatus Endonucleobacter sp. (ex Gigantidas childressi)]|nr:hypothetical protein [Candidatus Endonucleobacter sp. (ex Gigantidas childressi)]
MMNKINITSNRCTDSHRERKIGKIKGRVFNKKIESLDPDELKKKIRLLFGFSNNTKECTHHANQRLGLYGRGTSDFKGCASSEAPQSHQSSTSEKSTVIPVDCVDSHIRANTKQVNMNLAVHSSSLDQLPELSLIKQLLSKKLLHGCFIDEHIVNFYEFLCHEREINTDDINALINARMSSNLNKNGTDFMRYPHLSCWLHEREINSKVSHIAEKNKKPQDKPYFDGAGKVKEEDRVLIVGPGVLRNQGVAFSPQIVEIPKFFRKGTKFDVIEGDIEGCAELVDAYITLEKEINRNKVGTPSCAEPDYKNILLRNAYKGKEKSNGIGVHSNTRWPNTAFHSDEDYDITTEFIRNITECHYEKAFFNNQKSEFNRDFPEEVKEKLTTGLDYLPPMSIACESVMDTAQENNRVASYNCVLATSVIDAHLEKRNFLTAQGIAYCLSPAASPEMSSRWVTRTFEHNFNTKMGILCNLLDYLKDDGCLILDNLSYQSLILGYKYFSADAESFEDFFNKRSMLLTFNKSEKCLLIEIEVINAIGKPVLTSDSGPADEAYYFYCEGASNQTSVFLKKLGQPMKYPSLALVAIKKTPGFPQ